MAVKAMRSEPGPIAGMPRWRRKLAPAERSASAAGRPSGPTRPSKTSPRECATMNHGGTPHASSAPQPPWATYPHLRGQSSLYVAKQLGDFKSGARAGSSNAKVMQGVAATLGEDEVQALSAYLDAL